MKRYVHCVDTTIRNEIKYYIAYCISKPRWFERLLGVRPRIVKVYSWSKVKETSPGHSWYYADGRRVPTATFFESWPSIIHTFMDDVAAEKRLAPLVQFAAELAKTDGQLSLAAESETKDAG